MKLKFLVPLIAFVGMAVLLGVGLKLDPKELPSALIDKPAPDFSLTLLSAPDKTFSPTDLKGQRWLLNVWASWCVSCRYEHPLLNEIAKRTPIQMIGLNYKDEPLDAQQWLNERGNPYSQIPMDIKGDAGIDWGVYGVPETFVIDERGNIIYRHAGPITPQIVNQEILPLFDIAEGSRSAEGSSSASSGAQ